MNVALWVVAGLLAAVYLGAGLAKLTRPKESLAPAMGFVEDYSAGAVKAIGAVEVLGALGLVLPQATGIAPVLTPVAAVGLAIVQLGAIRVHVRRGERQQLPVNVVLLVLALFVAVGRFAGWGD